MIEKPLRMRRRLIAEEGLLVGGSSGSAIAAMVKSVKELGLGKGDVVVVILPDSIWSYLSKVRELRPANIPRSQVKNFIVRRRRLACSQRSFAPHASTHKPSFADTLSQTL